MPENFRPKDPADRLDYTVDALYSFLSSYELRRRRTRWRKIRLLNLGFGRVGDRALRNGQRQIGLREKLVVRRGICDPLE